MWHFEALRFYVILKRKSSVYEHFCMICAPDSIVLPFCCDIFFFLFSLLVSGIVSRLVLQFSSWWVINILMDVLRSLQNTDGGFATYELTRSYQWLEVTIIISWGFFLLLLPLVLNNSSCHEFAVLKVWIIANYPLIKSFMTKLALFSQWYLNSNTMNV